MSFLKRLFGARRDEGDDQSPAGSDSAGDAYYSEQEERPQVTAWIRLSSPDFENEREQQRLFELENALIKAIEEAGAGTYDTNELARGAFGMRLLGADPDRIVDVIRPLLADVPTGSYLTVRRGGSGTAEERLEIEPA